MSNTRRSALRSGLLTGVSTLAVSGSAAATVALLGHEFGRNDRTDGFLTAYGVYLVIAIAAQAFRTVVLPGLTRSAAAGRLGADARAYALSLLAAGLVATALAAGLASPIGHALTGREAAARVAADALPWIVAGGFLQLLAALGASALAAADDYVFAAVAYAAGALAGLALFAALAHREGIVSLAWGVTANGAVAAGIALAALARRGVALRGGGSLDPLRRLGLLLGGAAVPIAVQALYVVSLRLANGLDTGKATTFSYAYLIAAVLVQATASSVALVSSAPLTRRGLDADSAARHVVHSSWLSLTVVAAAAGVFALVGGRLVEGVLGSAYRGQAGADLGRLVAELAPWMVATIAYTVAYPLLFVIGAPRRLLPLAAAAVAVHVPLAYALRQGLGLPGIALALALSTFAVVAALLALLSPRALGVAALGLGRLALVAGALAAASFGLLSLLGGIPGAVLGLAVYVGLLAALRPRGLRDAWAYVRALH